METRCRGHVHVKIGVMNVMKPPEERNHVIGPMPPPVGVIHHNKSGDGGDPSVQTKPVEQTEMPILRPNGHRQWNGQHGQTQNYKTRNRHDIVPKQSAQTVKMLTPQWK